MSLHRMQVTIPAVSAVPADAVVNTWHFDITETVNAPPAIIVALDGFYTQFQNFRGAAYAWQSATAKLYDLEDPEPRVPVYSAPLPMSPTGTTGQLPHEVALCMSFQATQESGLNQKRRRNRIYLGPFAPAASATDGRPAPTLLTELDTAATNLLAASNGSVLWKWVIFSTFWVPPAAPPLVNNGWFDNAFDTQRRRGLAPTIRTTWVFP